MTNNEAISIVEELSKNNNGSDFQWASSPEEQKKLWKARHDVYYSVKALGNNMKVYSTDVCVPISRLVECISWAENEVKKLDLTAPMVGHVGDGNFHSIILYDPEDKEKQKRIRLYSDNLINKALELEGTITGEHGIGLQKKHYLLREHLDNIPVMKAIKRSLDENNIMNPGKIFDLN
jgi:D-lactate dehydrogenase (cytochrome)